MTKDPPTAPPDSAAEARQVARSEFARAAALLVCYLLAMASGGVLLQVGRRLFGLTAGWTAPSIVATVAAVVLGVLAGLRVLGPGLAGAGRRGRALGLLEGGFALSALAAPFLFALARAVYLALWPLLGGTAPGAWSLRFVLAASLLAAPSALFAGMVPALARMLEPESSSPETGPGRIGGLALVWSLSLGGLALGTWAGGVLVLPALGLTGGGLFGTALAAIAAAGTLLARSAGLEGPGALPAALGLRVAHPAGSGLDAAPAGGGLPAGAGAPVFVRTMTLALFGFTAWALFVCWSRVLGMITGPTDRARALVAAVILASLACGALIVWRLAGRLERRRGMVAVLAVGAALLAYASMYLVPGAALLYLWLVSRPGGTLFAAFAPVVAAALVVAPASVALGATLPLIGRPRRGEGSGVTAGLSGAVASLALGVAASEVVVRMAAVPAFGLRRSVGLAAAGGLLLAILLIVEHPSGRPGQRLTAVMALLGMMVAVGGFVATWDPRRVTTALYRYGARSVERFGSIDAYLSARQGVVPIFYREGRNATVMVETTVETSPDLPQSAALTIDGKIAAGTGADMGTQILTAHIPLLLHGPTARVLLIDYLTGVTAGSILRHPIESLTVIEREPVLFEAGKAFEDYNYFAIDDARLSRIADSPRARLLADQTLYDAIILATTDPWLPESAALVTREGYALLKSRLRPKGLVAQRLPVASTTETALVAMLRTFARVFDSVLVFRISAEDLLLLGSPDPLVIDVGWLRHATGRGSDVAVDLARAARTGPDGIVLAFRLGGEPLRDLMGPGPLSDDDRAAVEAVSARALKVHYNQRLLAALDGAWGGLLPYLKNYGALPKERAGYLYELAKEYLGVAGDPMRARTVGHELSALKQEAMARWVMGEALLQEADIDGALAEWEAVLSLDPDNLDALFSLGTFYLNHRDYFSAEPHLSRAARRHGDTAVVRYNYGRTLFYIGRHAEAISELRAAEGLPGEGKRFPLVDYLVGLSLSKLGRDDEGAAALQGYLAWAYEQNWLTPVEVDAHLELAEILERQGELAESMAQRQKSVELQVKIQARMRGRQGAAPIVPAPSVATGEPAGADGP